MIGRVGSESCTRLLNASDNAAQLVIVLNAVSSERMCFVYAFHMLVPDE